MTDKYDSIFSPERKQARRYDTPYRSRLLTDQVYKEDILFGEEARQFKQNFHDTQRKFYPEPSRYNIYFGELHGHSCLSDGQPSPDDYFRNLRDTAKLDFAALTDHNHGGLAAATLYSPKGDQLREATVRYNDPGIGVDWGVVDPILSPKDTTTPLLDDSDCNFVYGEI